MITKNIWDLYSGDLKRFIFSKVKDKDVTDDIFQDVFIKIHIKKDSIKDKSKLKSWIFAIARNTILDKFRAEKHNIEFEENQDIVAEEVLEHTEKDCLEGILRNLPDKYRLPLFLSDVKE